MSEIYVEEDNFNPSDTKGNKNSKRAIIFTFLVCIALIIAGFIINSNIAAKTQMGDCKKLPGNQIQACIVNAVNLVGSLSCKYIDDTNKDKCYTNAAKIENKPRKCSKIKEENQYYNCIGEVALYNDNHIALSKIKDEHEKALWLRKMAIKYNNSQYCRIIKDNIIHGICHYEFALKTNDSGYCRFIDKDSLYWEDCFFTMAKQLNNVTLCVPMNSIRKQQCLKELGG